MTRAERFRIEGHILSLDENAAQWEAWAEIPGHEGLSRCAATAREMAAQARVKLLGVSDTDSRYSDE